MKEVIRGIKNFIIYLIIRGLLGFLNALPLRWAYSLAGFLGRTAYRLFPGDKKTALGNLKTAFPNRSNSELTDIYIKSLKNIGHSSVDVLRFKKFGKKNIIKMVDAVGLDHFDRAYQRGKGIAAVTAHISNFELIAAWFGQKGYKASPLKSLQKNILWQLPRHTK